MDKVRVKAQVVGVVIATMEVLMVAHFQRFKLRECKLYWNYSYTFFVENV